MFHEVWLPYNQAGVWLWLNASNYTWLWAVLWHFILIKSFLPQVLQASFVVEPLPHLLTPEMSSSILSYTLPSSFGTGVKIRASCSTTELQPQPHPPSSTALGKELLVGGFIFRNKNKYLIFRHIIYIWVMLLLGIKSRPSHMLSKYSTTEPYLKASGMHFYNSR